MNLRKLLCGLLALCLLLTMAPAALMEEAAVEEQVVELGGEEVASEAVEAEDYKAIGIAGEGDLTLPTDLVQYSGKKGYSGSTYLALGESMTIEAADGYFIKSIASKNSRVASVDEDGAVEGLRVGKALISVTLGMDEYSTTVNCAVTVNVYDTTKPGAVELSWGDVVINDATLPSMDVTSDASFDVTADILPDGLDADIYWSSDKTSVAIPYYKVTKPGDDNTILLKGKGTAKITAKCGTVSAKFTVKVTDDNAPKSISAKTDVSGNKVSVGAYLPVYSVISPRPYSDALVTWTLDNTKYAVFANEDGDIVPGKTWTGSENCLLYGIKEGKVKLTAKTYNGKKSTIKIEVVDNTKPTKIEMYGFYNKEKFEAELYDEEYTLTYSTPEKPVRDAFLIVPVISNAYGELEVSEAVSQYANVQWKSSNTKVAEIRIYKNYVGYAQDQDETTLEDIFGNNVYDLTDGYVDYAAVVELKGVGTTTLTAKTKDGKKSFSVTLKVVNNKGADEILLPFGSSVKLNVGDIVDLREYVEVVPYDFFGTLTVAPTHSTSKLVKVDGGLYRADKAGTVTVKAKAGEKSKTFKVVISK